MVNRYDMASRRTLKRYPGHVLRKLRAERGVGRPPVFEHFGDALPYLAATPETMGVGFASAPGQVVYSSSVPRPAGEMTEEVQRMKNPKPIARLARRRGVRLTENQAECLAHIARFGNAKGYAPATVRSLEDRGLVSAKSGKLMKKARDILGAADLAIRGG